MVDPSILTPPSCVELAVAKLIEPLVLTIPLIVEFNIITPPNANVVAGGNVYPPVPPVAEITPLLIVIVDPSTLTPPSCVELAGTNPIFPFTILIPLVSEIKTPPNCNELAIGNEYCNDLITPLSIVIVDPSILTPPNCEVLAVGNI